MSASRSAAGSIPADSRISVSGAVSAAHRAAPLPGRLDAAEAGGGHDQPGRRHHRVRVGRRPGDLERQQRPEAAGHLQRRHRRRGQPRVVHRRHPRLPGQELRDREGVIRLPCDPQRQRLHPAQNQPALERPGDRAARRPPPPDRLGQLRVPRHDRAAEHVRVPRDRLGERVDRGHRAEIERLLQQPGRGRVVDHERRAGRLRQRSERGQVRHPQQRVGRRLRPQHGRPAAAAPPRPRRGRAGRPPPPPPRAAAAGPPVPACCSSRRAGTRSATARPPAPASAPSTPPARTRTSPPARPAPPPPRAPPRPPPTRGCSSARTRGPDPAPPATRRCWWQAAAAPAATPPRARSPHAPATTQDQIP